MDNNETIIDPFLKSNRVLLIAGTHSFINSRFAFGICYDLINNDVFLDTFDISKSNRPNNILIIKDNESKYEYEARYSEPYKTSKPDELIKTFSHLYFADKYDLKNKNLNEAVKTIEDKILDNNIELVVFDYFSYFKDYSVDEVFSELKIIIKHYQLPFIIILHSKINNGPENYISGANPLYKHSDEIVYLSNCSCNIKMIHLKSSDNNLKNEIYLKMDTVK